VGQSINKLTASHLLQKDRFRLINKFTPIMMLANLLTSPVLVALMWDVVPHRTLVVWVSIVFGACALTSVLYLYLKPLYESLETVPGQPIYFLLPLIFGLLWGFTGVFFFTPNSMTHTSYLVIFLFGMASGGVNVLSPLWSSYIALAVPTLLPFSISLLTHGYPHTTFLGMTIFSFLIIMLAISKMTEKSITNSLKIRYENMRLLEDLKIQTKEAKEANQNKSRFLAAASHDLRQPIHSLSLLTSAIEPEVKSIRGKKILSQIENANDTMLHLLHSLLDISKLDAGIIQPAFRTFESQEMIHSLIAEFQPIADKNGLELRTHSRPLIIKSDPVLLETIIRNLLQNALRYTKEGKVLVSCRQRKNNIQIQVWDTGLGIADDFQEMIFAEYQQLHNPERDQNKGLGLGLTICRRVAELLNIQLKLKSVVDAGSVFSLELPSVDQREIENHKNTPKKIPSNNYQENPLQDATILVIDDNDSVLNAMSTLLENWGCTILVADGIDASIKIAKTFDGSIDAIIADYRLRDNTTGVEAIDAFNKQLKKKVASILITGDTSPERMQELAAHGIPVLHKPIKEAHLKTVITKLLRMSQ